MTATPFALAVLALAPFFHQQPRQVPPQAIPPPSVNQQSGVTPGIYTISGRVVDGSTGRAVNGAVIVLWDRSKERVSGLRFPSSTGSFDIPNVGPGSYRIAAELPGARFSYRTETVDLDVRNANVTGLGLIITPLGPRLTTVSGRLVMEGSGPLPASIMRVRAGGQSVATQRDGTFQIQFRAEEKYPLRVDDLPDGGYIKSVSAGSWNPESEILVFSSTPPSSIQVTLAVGAHRLRGRVLDKTRTPVGPQAVVTLAMPSSPAPVRRVTVNPDGSFVLGQLRSGDYELRARLGAGPTTQSTTLPVTIGNQDRNGLEVVLKELTPQRGRVVMEGIGRFEDVQRFHPVIEVTDILGLHQLPIRGDGTFEFQSFEGDYSVAIKNVPVTYETFIQIDGASVEVKLRVVQGDIFPGFRLRPQR